MNLIVRTSCKTLYNVLSHSHVIIWPLGQFADEVGEGLDMAGGGGGGVVQKRESPEFRSLEVGISVLVLFT